MVGWLRMNSRPVGLFLTVFVVHVISPSVLIGDSRLSTATAYQFFSSFSLHLDGLSAVDSLPTKADLVSVDGHLLPFFPWPPMLLAAPAVLIWTLLGKSGDELSIVNPAQTFLVEIPTASVLIAITAVIVRQSVLETGREWATPRIAMLTGLAFAFTTSAWSIGSRALWQQTVSMLFLALATLAVQRLNKSGFWPPVLGFALAMAVINRPTNAIIVVIIGLWVIIAKPQARIRLVVAGGSVLIAFFAISLKEYGSLIPPYYSPYRFEDPAVIGFADGLVLNLISPSRGLLIYCPVVVLAAVGFLFRLRKHQLDTFDCILAVSLPVQLLIVAQYGSTGGHAYGPRLMIDILPFMMLLAGPIIGCVYRGGRQVVIGDARFGKLLSFLVVAALLWGFVLNASGAVLRSSRCWNVTPDNVDSNPSRIWDWSDAQYFRPYSDLIDGATLGQVFSADCSILSG